MKKKIIAIDPSAPDKNLIREAATIIKNGGIVAFPTDTCYGLAVNPFDPKAVSRLFEIKKRNANKALILLVSGIEMLKNLTIEISPLQNAFIEKFWPGPLTLIFNKKWSVPDHLGGAKQSIAIRHPKAEIPIQLIKQVGIPLTATSANRSGKPTATSAEEIKENIGENLDLILDAGRCEQIHSTILDLTVNPPNILRKGNFSDQRVYNFLKEKLQDI